MPPRNARKASGSRRYYDWHGERFWSVTTITKGGLPESYGLKKWARTIVAKGAVSTVQDGTLVPMVERSPEGAVEYLSSLPFSKANRAADLGSEVHAAIEAKVLERPAPEPSEAAAPFLEQFDRFVSEYDVRFLAAEATIYNRRHMYAGTLDSLVLVGASRFPEFDLEDVYAEDYVGPLPTLLDVKTGAGLYPEVGLQLSAYRFGEFIGLPDDTERPFPPTNPLGIGLHLQPTWFEPHAVDVSEDVFRAFLYARECYRWDLVTSKQVLRGRYPKGDETEGPEGTQTSLFTPDAVAAQGVPLEGDDDGYTS